VAGDGCQVLLGAAWTVKQEPVLWEVRWLREEKACGQSACSGLTAACLQGLSFLHCHLVESWVFLVVLNGLKSQVTPPFPIGQAAGRDGPRVWRQHSGGGGVWAEAAGEAVTAGEGGRRG
jgi:hypothetical protein